MQRHNRPEGSANAPYPVTMSNEQLLAQLGARALEILRTMRTASARSLAAGNPYSDRREIQSGAGLSIEDAARALGLLDEEVKP